MDELRGPNIQIVLHVKEGLGFGFLSSPFLVSGSLNGYLLETDPAVPCHAPNFDSELVWEADKRRFRNLRIQNVPVKIEVYTTGTQGRKNKVGYLLLSLLGAQPCPSNKISNIKHTWHKLLGVQTEGKCCHPQLLLSLTVEDWINTPTPRNDFHVLHSNETATYLPAVGNVTAARPLSVTMEEYLAESKRTATSTDLTPQLLTEEGLIQIGKSASKKLFILSFMLGAAENIDTLLPETLDDAAECSVSYSVFTHTIQTDRFPTTAGGVRKTAVQFNQRTCLRLCTDLSSLSRYFAECPHVVTRLRCGDKDIGICSTDLRKLVPTEDLNAFLESFCNTDKAITIGERCFMMPCLERTLADSNRKPFIDIEISLKYVGKYKGDIPLKPNRLAARSASHLSCKSSNREQGENETTLEKRKSTSCTDIDNDAASVTYNNNATRNTIRYISNNSTAKSQNEIADMIRKMYESFTISQEKLLNLRIQPVTSDVDVQQYDSPTKNTQLNEPLHNQKKEEFSENCENSPSKDHASNIIKVIHEKDVFPTSLPMEEREYLMKKCVEELEDWKEKQQDLFKFQMKQKEDYHLQMLSEEWNKRQSELEQRLSRGIEQCRSLATELTRATEDFRLRAYTVAQRERKLLQAKQTLEQNYTSKFRELREASKKMEDDMKHQTKLKDMRIEELETEMEQLQKDNDTIKTNLRDVENEAQKKKSGLTKGQTSDLIQELRNVEEKLDEAVQSKAFFKEQWGRAVRELHSAKLQHRRQMLTQLQQPNRLTDAGLDNIADKDRHNLRDDFYSNLMAETPVLADTYSQGFPSIIDGAESLRESVKMSEKPRNEKLNNLIEHRERLVQSESPDEEKLTKLNNEIRNILLTCET